MDLALGVGGGVGGCLSVFFKVTTVTFTKYRRLRGGTPRASKTGVAFDTKVAARNISARIRDGIDCTSNTMGLG